MFGKIFGGEFGKGLTKGLAQGLEKSFADDIERTKNNVDNLVIESYKGQLEAKKEFDRVYKENRKIVDQIIANLGGEQGADNPKAIVAAQGLISDQGLDGALKYSENLSNQFQLYGRDPIKNLGIAKSVNHSTPITADLLTKSTVPAINIPNIKELAKDTDVGIMKLFGNILDKDDDFTTSQVETRVKALARARGIDLNRGDLNLPAAVKVKLDPLVLGMQSNPTNEIIRLQNYLEDNKQGMSNDTEARVKNMIQVQQNIIDRQNKIKTQRPPGPFNEAEAKDYMKFITDQIVSAFDINVKRNDFTGAYISIGDKNKKNKLVMDYVNKIMITLNDAAKKGVLSKQGNFMTVVSQAILANKKLVDVDGVLTTVNDDVIFNQEDFDALKNKTTSQLNQPGKTKLSGMNQSQLVAKIKSMQPNTPDRTKTMDQLVKLIISNRKAQGTPISYNDAMNIAKNLIK